jgi:hypothetical protein
VRKIMVAFVLRIVWPLLLGAQQTLNNEAIIKLVKAGLSEYLIITTINSQAGSYDTSTDGIIALKVAGVTDKVVSAIVQKTAALNSNTAAQPSSVNTALATVPTDTAQEPKQPSAAPAHSSNKPRVFLSSASKGSNRNAERDQSMEMSKDLEKDCSGVKITINQQAADYTILLNHIEHGLLVRDNQIQIANKDGDLISRTKEGGSIKGDVKKACETIIADWTKNGSGYLP